MGLLTDNPVLAKEVRGRLRARRQSRNARIGGIIAVGAVVVLLYYFGLASLFSANSQSNADGLFTFYSIGVEMTLILFMVPSLGAGAITQEREQQTWNALLLSRLTPEEITAGKFISALLPSLIVLALFFPLKLIAAVVGAVSPERFMLTNFLLILTVCFCTAIALFWSWACRRTYIATAASFGSVAFLVVGTFVIYGLFAVANSSSVQPHEFPLLWINPYVAITAMADSGSNNHPGVSIFCCVTYFLGTIGLLAIVIRRLTRGPKELEQ